MKSRIAKIFALFSFTMALAVSAAQAQSSNPVKFHIPFDSVVGKVTLPAGDYTVRVEDGTSSKTVRIRNADGKHLFATGFIIPVRAREFPKQAKLVFNKYGDQYFLSQIWHPTSNTGQALPKSRAEREVAKNAQIARSSSRQEVLIAAQ